MALGNFAQAAKTAVIIARSEQELGNYKVPSFSLPLLPPPLISFLSLPSSLPLTFLLQVAHNILFDTYKSLESHNIKLLFELKRSLLVLHSYVLAKVLVKNKLHKKVSEREKWGEEGRYW